MITACFLYAIALRSQLTVMQRQEDAFRLPDSRYGVVRRLQARAPLQQRIPRRLHLLTWCCNETPSKSTVATDSTRGRAPRGHSVVMRLQARAPLQRPILSWLLPSYLAMQFARGMGIHTAREAE